MPSVYMGDWDLRDLPESDRQRVAAGLNGILEELDYPHHELNSWWNMPLPSLGGHSLIWEWLNGDPNRVRDVLIGMVEASRKAAAAAAQSHDIQERAHAIATHYAPPGAQGYPGV